MTTSTSSSALHRRMFSSMKQRVTVEPVIFLYMLGTFLLFSVFQNLVYTRTCQELYDESVCNNLNANTTALEATQAATSRWVRMSTLFMTVPSLVVDVYMGAWADVFGKRIALLLPPIGAGLGSLVYVAMMIDEELGVTWILLASFLQGIFGSFTSVYTAVLAYIGAVSDLSSRTSRMAVVLSMSSVAGTVGPLISGWMAVEVSHLSVFLLISVCHFSAVIYVLIRGQTFNTALNSSASTSWRLGDLFSLTHIKDSVKTCFVHRSKEERNTLVTLMLMALILIILTAGEMDILFLYLSAPPLAFDFQTFTTWSAARNVVGSISLMLLTPLLHRVLRASTELICALGLLSKMASLALLALAHTRLASYLVVVVGLLDPVALAAVRTLMSLCVLDVEQGRLYGLVAVIEDVGSLLGALIFNTAYPITRKFYQGTMYMVEAALLALPLLLLLILVMNKRRRSNQQGLFTN